MIVNRIWPKKWRSND